MGLCTIGLIASLIAMGIAIKLVIDYKKITPKNMDVDKESLEEVKSSST